MTSTQLPLRSPSDVLKRGYSDEEVSAIYDLARLFLESGQIKRAEAILNGLTEIAPDFAPAWLGLAYIHILNKAYDTACRAARSALQADPDFHEAMLYLIACLLTIGDLNSAGTFLGEIGERIEGGFIDNPNLIRFYRMQFVRYQSMQ